ncbi:hypothetical protein FHW16_004918 [Phyllobacterium myrsinacearum]|jgi:hypothetical protein|uniref:Lytic murein transglycosylase n=1 Tax=Phyllobacterium myrsinacearum TaxID=28101 RepID=A0A839EL27_9HYPH|nr:hypothetical protein [Phyllobacterium myrsinacearum]
MFEEGRDAENSWFFTPLCPVGHLPHKGGDHIDIDYLTQNSTLED